MALRLKSQANQIIGEKVEPDNMIRIDSLTKIEKATLKEIFKTIHNFQLGIKQRFTREI